MIIFLSDGSVTIADVLSAEQALKYVRDLGDPECGLVDTLAIPHTPAGAALVSLCLMGDESEGSFRQLLDNLLTQVRRKAGQH